MTDEPIIKIREISDKEIKELIKATNKNDIHIIKTKEDIDKYLEELDKELDKKLENHNDATREE